MCQSQTITQALDYLKQGHTISRPDHDGHLEGVKLKDGDLVILYVGEDENGNPDVCIWEPTPADVLATDWDVQ